MSLTPHRDAAAATVAQARRQYSSKGERDPLRTIAGRMDVDTTEAVMIGWGELRDIDVAPSMCGTIVIRVLASALASFALTACGGSQAIACGLLDRALRDLRARTLERISKAYTDGIVADVAPTEPRGRA